MSITENLETFKPEKFVIVNFYGEETCFAWRNRSFVFFRYDKSTNLSPNLPVIVLERDIKTFRSFEEQVFIVCKPSGVYKWNQSQKICFLSYTAIGMGIYFYQVLSVENQWLYMKDKRTKTSRELFQLRSERDTCSNICEISLNRATSDSSLRRGLCRRSDDTATDICVVVYDREVFTLDSGAVLLVYRCDRIVKDIVPVYKAKTIAGLALVSENSAVLVYVRDENLVFDKVYLESRVCGLCAGFDESSDNIIWVAHTDEEYVYYSAKIISRESFVRTGRERRKLLAIVNYKNERLVGLSEEKQLLAIEIGKTGLGGVAADLGMFLRLKPEMSRGSDKLMEEICDRAKELEIFNESLLDEQEKLKRINIYAHNRSIEYLPQVRAERLAGQLFLRVRFGNSILPINCYAIVALKSGLQATYCAKLVQESEELLVDMPVEIHNLDSWLDVSIDLVTYMEPTKPWCLIRNYAKSPKGNTEISSDRRKLLQAKLAALRKLMADGTLDMKKLSSIKQSIRRGRENL